MRSFIITCPVQIQGSCRFFSDAAYALKLLRLRQMSRRDHLNEIAELSSFATAKTFRRSFTGGEKNRVFTNVEVAQRLSEELISRGVDVVIGGSMALCMIVPPRQTKDIDINISAIPEKKLKNLLESMKDADLAKFAYHSSQVPKSRSLVETKTIMASFEYKGWPIDAFICPVPQDELRERIFTEPLVVDGLKFVPPECLCVMKMMCFPKDQRYFKDRADVQLLLESAKDIDTRWIREQLVLRDGENGPRVKEWDELVKEVRNREQG